MSKEFEALEEIKNHKIKVDVNIKYDNGDETQYRFETIKDMFPKEFAVIETALKEHEILQTIRDNFSLWIEPKYKATLQFQQCCTMMRSECEKLIEYFGEPRDE